MTKPHAAAERAAVRALISVNNALLAKGTSPGPQDPQLAQIITAEYAEAVEALQAVCSCAGEGSISFETARNMARAALARVRAD